MKSFVGLFLLFLIVPVLAFYLVANIAQLAVVIVAGLFFMAIISAFAYGISRYKEDK